MGHRPLATSRLAGHVRSSDSPGIVSLPQLDMRFPPVQRATAGGAHPALYICAAQLLDTISPPPIRTPTRPLYASPTRHTYQLTRARGRPKQTEHVQLRLQSENRYLNCSVQFQYLKSGSSLGRRSEP